LRAKINQGEFMKKRNFYRLFFACLVVAAFALPVTPAMAQADVYQFEAAALYTQTKDDDIKFQAYGMYAGYHFTPVPLTSLPWAEAAFLARASNVSIGLIRTDSDWDSEILGKINGDGYMISGNLEFYAPAIPIYISIEATRMKTNMESTLFEMESINTDIAGRLGFLPMPGMLVGALYGRTIDKREGLVFGSMPIDEEDTINYYGGFLKIVQPIGDGMAFGIDLTAQRINTTTKDNTGGEEDVELTDTNVQGMLAFYPVAQLGIGLTLETQRGDDISSEGNTYGVAAIFFPIPNVGINVSCSRFIPGSDANEKGEEILESDSFDVSVRVRF
jgi:hypothetical protein